MMKLAVLGGSFNPPHKQHFELARAVLTEYNYDSLYFIPVWQPPHKSLATGATWQDRVAMLNLALPQFNKEILNNIGPKTIAVELCELERQGTSYTIDTILYLEKKLKNNLIGKIGLIMGSDLVQGYHLWKDYKLLAQKTDILLAQRPENLIQTFDFPHKILKSNFLNISSAMIRENISQKKDWKHLVPDEICDYIKKRKLYDKY